MKGNYKDDDDDDESNDDNLEENSDTEDEATVSYALRRLDVDYGPVVYSSPPKDHQSKKYGKGQRSRLRIRPKRNGFIVQTVRKYWRASARGQCTIQVHRYAPGRFGRRSERRLLDIHGPCSISTVHSVFIQLIQR